MDTPRTNMTFGPSSPRPPSHVVGIGASAGGLEAIERFFDNLPKETGLAFVIIQHLSPDFKSMMDELLARHTQLPIHLVENGIPVEADHIYLIPPKNEMIISGGRLLLSEQDRHQERTLPIDIFFRSLAQDCGPRAVAVVLSGGGSDGSRGIRDVHEAGGLVIVQDVDSAQFDGMPRTAADSGLAHWVLAPSDMPRALLEHTAGRPNAPQGGPVPESQPGNATVVEVYRMLQQEYGIDFTHYKPSTVTRRIERRLALAQSTDIDEYIRRLKSDRSELDVLYRDLLIEVTHFFRDPQAFKVLEEQVLPELLARQPREVPLRLWVAGCATGEEAYSLAILLEDLMANLGERPVKIFATDVHRGSLEHATQAIYTREALTGVSEDRLARYFTRIGERYQVVPELRQRIVFAQHNVIKDAPFTRVDLVTCRNLLIYLQPAAQQKALSLFHFALNRNGFLFLGPSETVGPLAVGYETLDKHWRVYRKRSDARIPVDTRLQPATTRTVLPPFQPAGGRYSLSQLLGTYDALLEQTMPSSLLVNERAELVHAFGGAGRLLHHRDGRQGLDVLELVGPELKMVLVGGLKRAISEPTAIVYRDVRIPEGDGARAYKVTIQRIGSRGGGAPHLLVSLEQNEAIDTAKPFAETEVEMDQVSHDRLRALEAELAHTKENLQSAIEELETSNEELQASNEELQTSNEELQSTNEELQSVNEELYTVNAEYQRKISELTEVTNDMDNLLASTEIGTIFLDPELKIRKFTPQIAKAFSLVPHDVGRSIETFVHQMNHPELVEDLNHVLKTGQPAERELGDIDGKAFYSRILPYRTKGSIAGVVITLIDVSGLKLAEDALFHERYLLNSLLASIPDAIYFKDVRGRLIRANEAMAGRLGLKDPAAAVGKTALELPNQEVALELHRKDEVVIRTGETHHYKLERSVPRQAGEPDRWDLVTRLPLRDRAGVLVGMAAIFRDVTEQKMADEKIQDSVRRRDQFLAMLSHELRNPLGAIVTATALLKSRRAAANTPRFLGILERQSAQMANLLDDLLEASRVTQNKIALKRHVLDLRSAAREAADTARGLIESRGLTFTTDLDGEPLWIDADQARLQQIQANLLNNAAKYTPKGGHVTLQISREGTEAVFRLKDDGVGLPPEMVESVFELFVQSKRTLDRSGGGLGVGLTLVRSLVNMHGGTVHVYSGGEGQGCEFVVRLPLTDRKEAPEELPPSPAASVRGPLREGATIVVVEDQADSRDTLCELLSQEGFACRTAENGSEGLALIDELLPPVAILDVGLPGIDGFEVARRLRADPRHSGMLLIALTGYGQAAERARGQEAGFDEHLVKPVNFEELLGRLAEMKDSRKSAATGAKS
jgi:two-component system CheB/CheR fusion protein